MKVNLIRNQMGFIASTHIDEDKMSYIKIGDVVNVEMKKPRNGKFHRKFFALVGFVFESQERYKTTDDLLIEIKLKAGHYQEHITTKGIIIYVPKSISFASMDGYEFDEFYKKVTQIVLVNFLEGMTEDELNKHVDMLLGFV